MISVPYYTLPLWLTELLEVLTCCDTLYCPGPGALFEVAKVSRLADPIFHDGFFAVFDLDVSNAS